LQFLLRSDTQKNICMRLTIAALAIIAAALPAIGAEPSKSEIRISQPWARATPGGAKVAAGYMTITNTAKSPDKLIGGSTTASGAFELHDTSTTDGIMRMRRIENGIVLAPGATVRLQPGGMHVMLIDLKHPLAAGDRIKGTLLFEKAGAVELIYDVAPIGAPAPTSGSGSHTSSHKHH
jgi:copper(I)-binding protein